MNREQYSQRHQILMRRLISIHTKPIYTALQSQIKDATQLVREVGAEATKGRHWPLNDEIAGAVTNLYIDAAKRAKKKYVLTKSLDDGGTDFINRVLQYLKSFLLDKVVIPVSDTTKEFIDKALEKAVSKGWGVEKTVKFLETNPITKVRARLIVRTESVRATNYAQLTAADDETYQIEKSWIAIEDLRTRVSHSHAGVDGQVQDLDEPFTNGLLFPGDPNADAAEVCNCRCTMGYRLKRDLSGNPIKKVNKNVLAV